VLRRPLPYRPVMLAPLLLLHVSLAFRLVVGDGWGSVAAVRVGGVANVVAVLAFLGVAVWSVAAGPPARPTVAAVPVEPLVREAALR